MTQRREFLTVMTALAGSGVVPSSSRLGSAGSLAVSAAPTVFHGHPAGQTTLVRFAVSGTDAPAGRLRVFDARGRLLGTAGLLRGRDGLVGELWIPLALRTTVRSELEMPGTHRPIRTRHELDPRPHWTIHWLTLADPDDLEQRLAGTSFLVRGALVAGLTAAGVRGDPVGGLRGLTEADHVDLLRATIPAARLTERFGIPVAALGVQPTSWQPYLGPALAGAGVQRTIGSGDAALAEDLGFAFGRTAMVRRIEEWLDTLGSRSANDQMASRALVVGTDLDVATAAHAAVQEWNGMYAFPRLLTLDPDQSADAPIAFPTRRVMLSGGAGVTTAPPNAEERTRLVRDRERKRQERADLVFQPLVRAVAPTSPTLDGVARRFAFPVSGALVFNPSPFGRSDIAIMPDGSRRIVTDVPGLGYAFIPDGVSDAARPRAESVSGRRTAENGAFRVTIDPRSGGIASIVSKATGAELVDSGGNANAVEGARLEQARWESLPGLGEQLVVQRSTPNGPLTTRVILADSVPWVEVKNEATPPGRALEYHFAFADDGTQVEWEVAAGTQVASPPIAALRHLRWIALRGTAGSVLLATPDTGHASLTERGRLVAYAPSGVVRFRIGFYAFAVADDPWRFGWSVEPFRTASVLGNGDVALPTFGRLFEVRDPGVAITALQPARDGVGIIVYLQELMGVPREVPFVPGVLSFDQVLRTDFAERDVTLVEQTADGEARVPIAAFGFTALRLLGISVAA